MTSPRPPGPGPLRQLALASAAGSELAATVGLGALLGQWLDGQAGSAPWLLLTLSIGSLVLGLARLTRALRRAGLIDEDLPPP